MLATEIKFAKTIDPTIQSRIKAFLTETVSTIDTTDCLFLVDAMEHAEILHVRPYPGGITDIKRSDGALIKIAPIKNGKEILDFGAFLLLVSEYGITPHRLILKFVCRH